MRAMIVLNTDHWDEALKDPETFVAVLDDSITRMKTVRGGSFGIMYCAVGDPDLTHKVEVGRAGIRRSYQCGDEVVFVDE